MYTYTTLLLLVLSCQRRRPRCDRAKRARICLRRCQVEKFTRVSSPRQVTTPQTACYAMLGQQSVHPMRPRRWVNARCPANAPKSGGEGISSGGAYTFNPTVRFVHRRQLLAPPAPTLNQSTTLSYRCNSTAGKRPRMQNNNLCNFHCMPSWIMTPRQRIPTNDLIRHVCVDLPHSLQLISRPSSLFHVPLNP